MSSGFNRFVNAGHRSSCFTLWWANGLKILLALHPQDAAKVFVNLFGSLTLAAASEETVGRRERMGSKHELILLSPAKRACLPVKFSAY